MLVIDNDRKISRIGMVVSRKVAGSAVNRNRIRRLIRETFRLGFDQEGLDIVIVARGATAKLNNAAIRMALCGLWAKIADKHMKAPQ